MSITSASRFIRCDDVLYAPIGEEESVMVSIGAGKYYGLNAVASRVLELLEAPRAVVWICAQIFEEFDVDAEICESDIIQYIEILLANGVIRTIASSGA
jgi:hypothetical protein